jgi:hypothetical protein
MDRGEIRRLERAQEDERAARAAATVVGGVRWRCGSAHPSIRVRDAVARSMQRHCIEGGRPAGRVRAAIRATIGASIAR